MRKTIFFACVTLILSGVIAFCMTGTVISQSKDALKSEEAYYQVLEEQYLKDMKEFLKIEGFEGSGVTLTRTVEEDGRRDYVISIYNRRFSRLDNNAQELLLEELCRLAFPEENCSFKAKFL